MVKFFKCEHCGNIIELIQDNGVKVMCCGENMVELIPGKSDGAAEKHVPFTFVKEGKLVAQIGEVIHPMEEKHYIQWIVFANEHVVKRVNLKPGESPVAHIGPHFKGMVYEYCNLHGLWVSEIK